VETPSEDCDIAALSALLKSICSELFTLSFSINNLGEMMADTANSPHRGSIWFQQFDILSQQTYAFANLVVAIAGALEGGAEEIMPLIEKVPFHDIRERLYQAVDNRQPKNQAVAAGSINETEWF
jgi:hypothetical protein